jgi:hypothetical protein
MNNVVALSKVMESAAEGYDPYKGWSTCAQPIAGLHGKEYRELATQALPAFQEKLVDFCDKNKLNYVVIRSEDYREYEKGPLPFRQWLESYCYFSNQNINSAHVAIVGACVKEEKSEERKSQSRPADRTRDNLRAMFVVLDGKNKTAHAKSLDRLGDVITALESDEQTVARKNMFFAPKENGYRGAKGVWVVDVPKEQSLGGLPILAEIKIEHEAQQDANRLTRKIMAIKRSTDQAMSDLFNRCSNVHKENDNGKITSGHYLRMSRTSCLLTSLERSLYDTEHSRLGFNRFLDPQKREKHKPSSLDVVIDSAKQATDVFAHLSQDLHVFINQQVRTYGEKLLHVLK